MIKHIPSKQNFTHRYQLKRMNTRAKVERKRRDIREGRGTPHQKVEHAEAEHRERDADVSVVVEEVEHADTQATAQHDPSSTSHIYDKPKRRDGKPALPRTDISRNNSTQCQVILIPSLGLPPPTLIKSLKNLKSRIQPSVQLVGIN